MAAGTLAPTLATGEKDGCRRQLGPCGPPGQEMGPGLEASFDLQQLIILSRVLDSVASVLSPSSPPTLTPRAEAKEGFLPRAEGPALMGRG